MITWQQLANFLPLAGVLVTTGIMLERIRALRIAVDKLADALSASAERQGRRIGNLETFVGLTADGHPVDRDFSGRVRGPEPK